MKTIALSAGHSVTDPGAIYNGLIERDLNEKIVEVASNVLRSHGVGVLNPDKTLNLSGTIKWINDRKDQIDLCCEIHINSSSKPNQGLGLEGWHYRGSEESRKFASFLVNAIAAESGMSSGRGVKDEKFATWGKLGFVHDTIPLACLIECGFINTDADRQILSTDSGLYNIGKGVARGVLSYLGMEWKPNEVVVKPQEPDNSQFEARIAVLEGECLSLKDRLQRISDIARL